MIKTSAGSGDVLISYGPARFPWNILYAANEIPRASDVSSVHRVVDVFQGEGI